jgi:hypothetical protein
MLKLYNGLEDTLFKVTTEYGDVVITSTNDIHTVATKYSITGKAFRDIDITTDYLVSKREIVDKCYVKLSDFSYTRSEYNNSNRLFTPKYLPLIFNEDLAYLCGNIYGDGCDYNGIIELALADDLPECTEKLNKILINLFGYGIGDYGFNIKQGDGKLQKLILNKFVRNFLSNFGVIKQKGGEMLFPSIIQQSPRSVVLSFFS